MTNLEKIQSKLYYHRNELVPMLTTWKHAQKKIVFTNGCFDLMHAGHIDYLAKAADLGDIFIVGLNSDSSVSALKGPHRPITNQKSRMQVLASFFFIDAVVIFDEYTPYELIQTVVPHVLVKGGDYKAEEVVGNDIVTKNGGKTIILDFVPGYSTSLIEKKIVEQFQKKL